MEKGRNDFVPTLFYFTDGARTLGAVLLRHLAGISGHARIWLPGPPLRGTNCRCNRRGRPQARQTRKRQLRHSDVPREPHGPRQGIDRSWQIPRSRVSSAFQSLLEIERTMMVRPTRSLVVTVNAISFLPLQNAN